MGIIFVSLGQMPRPGIAGLYDKCMFNFLRNCQSVLQISFYFTFPPAGYLSSGIFFFFFASLSTRDIVYLLIEAVLLE